MTTAAWTILAIGNLPIYVLFGWVVFHDFGEFLECLRFWITPDILSAFRGEWIDDQWGELRLFLWVAMCALAVFSEGQLLLHLFH